MSWSGWTRQAHRWLSVAFTLCVVANVTVNLFFPGREQLALLVGLSTLVPLLLLLFSGLYLFALPYATRWRGSRSPKE